MPPRLNFCRASRSLAIRSRPSITLYKSPIAPVASRRGFADEKDSNAATGPNQDVLGHVSEEAADVSKVKGETGPDLGQGTPVQEVGRNV
jgi:small subunit ribosomal protein S7